MTDYIAIGDRLRTARKALRLTQAQVAELLGLSPSFYGHIERGTRCPSFPTFKKICEILDIDAEYLIFGKARKRKEA